MKILITGITGYLGRQLAAYASQNGHKIAGIVRSNTESFLGFDVFKYDGSYESVKSSLDLFEPDVIFHLATSYAKAEGDVESIIESNIKLPLYLCEASKNNPRALITVGSFWQFGCAVGNNHCVDLYAASKSAFETLAEFYLSEYAFKVCVVYLYGTYGENDGRGKVLDSIISAAKKGQPLKVSPGEQLLNLVHVQDAINALMLAAEVSLSSQKMQLQRYAVYSKVEYSLRSLVELCELEVGRNIDADFGAIPYRHNEVMKPLYPYPLVPGWIESITVSDYIKLKL